MPVNYTQQWLEDPMSIRGILVEVTVKDLLGTYGTVGGENTLYLSNIGYTTASGSQTYLPYLTGLLDTTESLSIEGGISMAFGDIEVYNPNGDLDDWLDSTKFIWANRSIQVYLGDPRWVLDTVASIHDTANGGFEKIFDGIVEDIDSKSRETLNLKIRDKLQILNMPISDGTVGGYGTWAGGQTNQDTLRPLVFGEVFNISPLLVDPSLQQFIHGDTSRGSIVTSITNNVLTCTSTAGFVVDKFTAFNGPTFGGITHNPPYLGINYYIKEILSPYTFTISDTIQGPVKTLTNGTGSMPVQNFPYLSGALLEVRDNGAPIYTAADIYTNSAPRPINVTINGTRGMFRIDTATSGNITASVQSGQVSIDLSTGNISSTYVNNIANLVALIVTQYGPPAYRLPMSDLDLTNFLAFSTNSNNTQPVGLYVNDRANVLAVCQELLASTNAQMYMNRKGKLQLLQLGVYTSDTPVTITDANIIHHSLAITRKTDVVAATKIGYCRNYTVQNSLASSLPAAHYEMFSTEWVSETVVDTEVQKVYKLDAQPVQIDTALITKSDAIALATRLNNYFKVPRIIYSFIGTSALLSLKLGQEIILYHNRFGLSGGKSGQVISLNPNWINGTINIEVII